MAATEHITSADQLLLTPGLGRCELLRGELNVMSPAGSEHGRVVMNVAAPLAIFVKKHGLGTVFGAETGFQIGRDPDTVRAPDVAFVRAERIGGKLGKGFFPGAPDLAVEVVSPSDRAADVLAKVHDWIDAGCRAVWVVDPEPCTVAVYREEMGTGTSLDTGSPAVSPAHSEPVPISSGCQVVTFIEADELGGDDVVPGFCIRVAAIFAQ
jgi:Uma2 family endonuclease